MSRYYGMTIVVTEYKPSKVATIKEAAELEWDFTDWYEHENRLTATANGNLCGGETDDDFADRLAKTVWQANGGFCEVSVQTTCLEYLPYEDHSFDEDDYGRITGTHAETT
jgi:hypothetical protein